MTWTELGGILASLAAIAGTFYKMYRDNKSLAKQLETISTQNGTVENAHEKILNQQNQFREQQNVGFLDLANSVGAMRKSVDEEAFLRKQIQANDQTAYDAVANLQKYLINTKDQKDAQMAKVASLKQEIVALKQDKKELIAQLHLANKKNQQLQIENQKLRGQDRGHSQGPQLSR
ncbi:hypothetical protein [Fructobacillus tropaeoli]|nr:hypothetical protein [Fructobacillus tropaeoli]